MIADDLRALLTSNSDIDLWSEWQELSMSSTAWKSIPKEDGVYIIKASTMLPRLNGDSDIVKIGQGILSRRIKAYIDKNRESFPATEFPKRGTARRIRNFWNFTNYSTYFSYISLKNIYLDKNYVCNIIEWANNNLCKIKFPNVINSSFVEQLMLIIYYKEHAETPPLHMSFS
jgi:hypothetical protein